MGDIDYLMESIDEAIRLDVKTDPETVRNQALWAGLQPGMRVVDVCCGSGKTTSLLHALTQPGGITIGLDGSQNRVAFAQCRYAARGVEFMTRDVRESLTDLGQFDFVWVRFVLEYFRADAAEIVQNIATLVRPGGILCLIDLDHNCMNHFELPPELQQALFGLMRDLEECGNFDPYAGRKLYSHLYRLGYQDIALKLEAHHLIFGQLKEVDACNWMKKLETGARRTSYPFSEFEGGCDEFIGEFRRFFTDPGRFTYTPAILCRGRRPPP